MMRNLHVNKRFWHVTCFCCYIMTASLFVHADTEKYNTGWRLNIDNNIFQRYMKDRDYTGGIAFTASGGRAQSGWLNIDPVRAWLFDSVISTGPVEGTIRRHSVQYGLTWFTPDDITATEPILDDRPFASLLYITNTALTVRPASNLALRSSLSLGLLGLDMSGSIQSSIHELTGSQKVNGWDNQVSSGGEPTAMLTLSVQREISASDSYQLTSHLEGNVGYSTDVNAGLNWRWGRLNSPWWSFNPLHYEYMESASGGESSAAGLLPEFYFFAAVDVKYRIYSVLLQGQFRDSVHTLNSDQIEHAIAGIASGVARDFGDGYQVSLTVRGTTPEFKGPNSRNQWWASLALSRTF